MVYAGGGYAVLAVEASHETLQHSLNWAYHPIYFSSGDLSAERDHVLSLATWAAMPPYCKYCHSMDHILTNCASRKQKITCDLCGVSGHFKRSCPCRNEDPDNSTKKRKVSKEHQNKLTADAEGKAIVARAATTQATANAPTAATAASIKPTSAKAAADVQAALIQSDDAPAATVQIATPAPAVLEAQADATAHATAAPAATAIADVSAAGNAAAPALQHLHNTRSKSTSTPIAPSVPSAVPLCKHCGLPGHKMNTSKHCLQNPKRLLAQQGTGGLEDRMDTDNVDDDGSVSIQN
ncbi:hypothetical protein [Parasitella parasitica]|uniref:CCHC-type domain-containing protein n=1 Tax=Parasitella parasitica TaxID=35722 RepID=A0A0B7NUH4_9FUNG|nr:hypothetical protein [Parasitella parasitica]